MWRCGRRRCVGVYAGAYVGAVGVLIDGARGGFIGLYDGWFLWGV